MNSDWQLLLVSNKLIFIWAAISALHSRFFVPMLFPVLQKELRSGRAARFADSKFKFKRIQHPVFMETKFLLLRKI
jgi:hypothetical protein